MRRVADSEDGNRCEQEMSKAKAKLEDIDRELMTFSDASSFDKDVVQQQQDEGDGERDLRQRELEDLVTAPADVHPSALWRAATGTTAGVAKWGGVGWQIQACGRR